MCLLGMFAWVGEEASAFSYGYAYEIFEITPIDLIVVQPFKAILKLPMVLCMLPQFRNKIDKAKMLSGFDLCNWPLFC